MTTYIITAALVFFLSLLAAKSSIRQTGSDLTLKDDRVSVKVLLSLTAAVLIFVAGCRYYVGTDYGAYYKGYSRYAKQIETAVKNFDEPGMPILAGIMQWITDDAAYYMFACSFITIALTLRTTYRFEESYFMATLLVLFSGIWEGSFNGVRQYIAAAIVFSGYGYIQKRKLLRYLILVFLATCFHFSAVIMIIPYFILRNKFRARNVVLLAIGTVIVATSYETVFSAVGLLKDADISVTGNYLVQSVNVFRVLVAVAPSVLCMFLYASQEKTPEKDMLLNALVVHASAMLAASNSAYLARVCIYTAMYLPIAIPHLIRISDKRMETVIRAGVVVMYGTYWLYGLMNSGDLIPFRWIFER